MSASDHDAVQRVRNGDTEAFGCLVATYEKAVFRIAMATTGDAAEAEDLTQISFVQAFTDIGELRDGRRFAPWLYAIAHNTCRDWLRKHRSRPVLLGNPPRLPNANPVGLPNNPDHHTMGDEPVTTAVNSLPLKYRAVVVLRCVSDLSYEDIGRALGVSVPAVKMRWHRARKMLQQRLAERLEDSPEEAFHDLPTD